MLSLRSKLTNVMNFIRRSWVWLSRFRHRRGYGVHSPAAYAFITDVVYERTAYYAYADLLRLHPWWERWVCRYPVRCCRMLFRLANYAEPSTMTILGDRPIEAAYWRAAVPSAQWKDDGVAALTLVTQERLTEAPTLLTAMPEKGVLVCEHIHANADSRACWQALKNHPRATLTFDLYVYGIVLLDRPLTPAHYIVNF